MTRGAGSAREQLRRAFAEQDRPNTTGVHSGGECWAQVRIGGRFIAVYLNCRRPVVVCRVNDRALYCRGHGRARGLL